MLSAKKNIGLSAPDTSSDKLILNDRQKKIIDIFFYTVLGATVATMIGVILFYAYSLANMYHDSESALSLWLLGVFSDFVEIMNFSLDDSPYLEGVGSSYPPIAIAILYPFALICKGVFSQYASMEALSINELTSLVARHPQFWIALLLFFFISMSAIAFTVIGIYKPDLKTAVKITLIIAFSAPFVYAIMRGNTIYFALIFTLLFLLLYRSKNPVLRELSYICLAVAGCIKIYPLFFGVFLLKDKKIFASVRVAVYFVLLFALSFNLFPGSSGDADPFFENLLSFASDGERLSCFRNLSITALLYKIVYAVSPAATEATAFSIVNLILLGLLFIIATITATYTSSRFSRAVICAAIVILIPPISYLYVTIFMIIPFMEYIVHVNAMSRCERIFYGSVFTFLMLTPILLPQIYVPHMLIILSMLIYEAYKVIKGEIIPRLKNLKVSKI